MASLLAKKSVALTRISFYPRISMGVKYYSDKTVPIYDPAEGKEASRDISMPDELGGAVGIERWELLQKAKGIEDPFLLGGVKLVPGTREKPTLILSTEETRTFGCVCDVDSTTIRYTTLCLGETSRCQCGYFFKLVPQEDEI